MLYVVLFCEKFFNVINWTLDGMKVFVFVYLYMTDNIVHAFVLVISELLLLPDKN